VGDQNHQDFHHGSSGGHLGLVSNGGIASGLDHLTYLFGRLRRSGTGLLLPYLDFSMRLFLRGSHCVFGILGTNGQIGQLLGESPSRVFPDRSTPISDAVAVRACSSEATSCQSAKIGLNADLLNIEPDQIIIEWSPAATVG
jgi:hypothetical protein